MYNAEQSVMIYCPPILLLILLSIVETLNSEQFETNLLQYNSVTVSWSYYMLYDIVNICQYFWVSLDTSIVHEIAMVWFADAPARAEPGPARAAFKLTPAWEGAQRPMPVPNLRIHWHVLNPRSDASRDCRRRHPGRGAKPQS